MGRSRVDQKTKRTIGIISYIILSLIFASWFIVQNINAPSVNTELIFPAAVSHNHQDPVNPIISNITITNNSDIATYSMQGDGLTWDSPFIIENFTIHANGTDSIGIEISNTTDFILIRNFYIDNFLKSGISLQNVQNIRFEDGYIYQSVLAFYTGIKLSNCSDVYLKDIKIYNMCDGALFFENVHDSIIDNITTGYNFAHLIIRDSSNLIIKSCTFSNSAHRYDDNPYHNFIVENSNNITYSGNFIGGSNGFEIFNSTNQIITHNYFQNNRLGYFAWHFCTLIHSDSIMIQDNMILSYISWSISDWGLFNFTLTTNVVIKSNTIKCDQAILELNDVGKILFKKNYIYTYSDYILSTREGTSFKNQDYKFIWNTITGKYYKFSDEGISSLGLFELLSTKVKIEQVFLFMNIGLFILALWSIGFISGINSKEFGNLDINKTSERSYEKYKLKKTIFCGIRYAISAVPLSYLVYLCTDDNFLYKFSPYIEFHRSSEWGSAIIMMIWFLGLLKIVYKNNEIWRKYPQLHSLPDKSDRKKLLFHLLGLILPFWGFVYFLNIFRVYIPYVYFRIPLIVLILYLSIIWKNEHDYGVRKIEMVFLYIFFTVDFIYTLLVIHYSGQLLFPFGGMALRIGFVILLAEIIFDRGDLKSETNTDASQVHEKSLKAQEIKKDID